MKKLSPILLSAACMALLLSPALRADEYDTLRGKWQTRLTGGSAVNTSDADIAQAIATSAGNAQTYWDAMDKGAARTALWADLATWTASATITNSYGRLYTMAVAYTSTGSPLKGNANLAADIVAALDWLYNQHYNPGITYYDNWWDWHIGTPQSLTNSMTLMYGQLSAAQIANYLGAIDKFVPDPSIRLKPDGTTLTTETGANLLDKSLAVILRGMLGKSAAKITQGRDAISPGLLYVTTGDGFYADGSFVQHTYVPYTGGYGPAVIDDMSKLLYLLTGSTWAFTDPHVANVYTWATDAFRPMIYDGAVLDAVRGRGVARQYSSDHTVGRALVTALVRLTQAGQTTAPSQSAELNAAIKGWMQRDTSFGSNYYAPAPSGVVNGVTTYSAMPVYEMALLKALQADSAVTPAAEPAEAHVFASMDRVVQRDNGFGASLSMFSKRMSAFEYGNNENVQGWWTGMGMLSIYNSDLGQYDGNFWPTVDSRRLPGTTTDRSGSGTPVAWKNYANTQTWVGGAELGGRYASVGMQFATSGVTGSSLSGKKAWFLFGDKIVAVGADIASSDGVAIETIVENRKLNSAGNNALTVNGAAQSTTPGNSLALNGVQWAHLAGSVSGADLAWYFPDAPVVNALRESRSAAWNSVYSAGDTTLRNNTFVSLALPHGANPTAGAYSYVILPKRTAAQAAAYASAPTVAILARSSTVSAARDNGLGLVGANFWSDASTSLAMDGATYLTSNKKAAVITQETGNVLQVSVADPTQLNTGSISLEIARNAGALVSASSEVTVTQLSPTIKLSINVNGSAGKSFTASFRLMRTVSLPSVADAYVRDGTYAATNYGATPTMVIKNDTAGYARQALVRFDLSSISGTITAAKLKLAPRIVGQTTAMTHNIYQVGNGWTESGVNWNNRPADMQALGSWAVPAINTYATLDVTSATVNAAAVDKLLSLRVAGAANYGANGWVEYASKEYATTPRPALDVTYY